MSFQHGHIINMNTIDFLMPITFIYEMIKFSCYIIGIIFLIKGIMAFNIYIKNNKK